jgi:hypothetical protein
MPADDAANWLQRGVGNRTPQIALHHRRCLQLTEPRAPAIGV